MRLLDDMSMHIEQFHLDVKKRMLESAVENILELANIKDIDTNRTAIGGSPLTYFQYKDTLLAAATRRDQWLMPTSTRTKRVVQMTEVDYGNPGEEWHYQ